VKKKRYEENMNETERGKNETKETERGENPTGDYKELLIKS